MVQVSHHRKPEYSWLSYLKQNVKDFLVPIHFIACLLYTSVKGEGVPVQKLGKAYDEQECQEDQG